MRLGIFAKTFAGSDPLTVLAAAGRAGFSTVQYNMSCSGLASMPEHVPRGTAARIREAIEQTGVDVSAVSATYNMIHPDPAVRFAGHAGLDRIAAVARDVGAPLVTLCTGTRDRNDKWRAHPDNAAPEAWADLTASMETAVAVADRYDLALGIEPELGNVVDSAAKARRLIEEIASPRIRIVLDPANLFTTATTERQRALVGEAMVLLGDRIAMAHAKDRNTEGGIAAAGRGVLDYPFYLKRLRVAGFAGDLITHDLSESEAPGVARFLTERLAEVDATS